MYISGPLRFHIQGKFLYKSYDKRKDFNFEVVKFPHLHGKIPRKPSYGVFTSQLLRFCEVNGTVKNFCNDVQDTIKIFVKQGFDKLKLMGHYKSFCEKYYYKWSKYGCDIVNLINLRTLVFIIILFFTLFTLLFRFCI